jgi:hypothetical protein
VDCSLAPILGPILPIQIWGTDARGSIFRQSVSARDVSETGALLDGLKQKLDVGDLIGVKYHHNRAHVRITGIEEVASGQSSLCSVQLMDSATCPWKDVLPKMVSDESRRPKERRRHERYPIPVGLEIRQYSDIPMHVRATDVSAGGCYVETMLPLSKGTEMRLTIWLESGRMATKGIVRTSHIAVGMGIEFLDMTLAEVDLLERFLQASVSVGGAGGPI